MSKEKETIKNQKSEIKNLIFLPLLFLFVTLLGGLRFRFEDSAFLFLKPQLICLILASILLVAFYRAEFFKNWFSEEFSLLKNVANGFVLFTLFTATVQIFNSLLPEKSIAFWIVVFCFLWSLWTNLFAELSAKKLFISLSSLLGLAFIVKYFLLANLVSNNETWTQKIFSEVSAGLLDLPKFASGTGYVQFFALAIYIIGVWSMTSASGELSKNSSDKTS
jgi:hypothetical protein